MSQQTHLSSAARRTPSQLTNGPNAERLQPLRCIGNWQLTQLHARGAFADVFLAKPLGCRPDWPADYVIKVLNKDHAQDELSILALAREAVVGSSVSQAHLVPILESHVTEAPHYVVMPRLEGAAVSTVIRSIGRIEPRQAFWITRQVSEALQALHAKDWLHADVKPANVIVSATGHATLVDLGFALRKREAVLTAERMARGSLSYIAPEVMTSAHSADQRSDIYSLGICLFEMLTGRLPFVGDNAADVIEMHRGCPVPDVRQFGVRISDSANSVVKRMTSKQPVRRPQNTEALIGELALLEMDFLKAAAWANHRV